MTASALWRQRESFILTYVLNSLQVEDCDSWKLGLDEPKFHPSKSCGIGSNNSNGLGSYGKI